MNTSIKTVFEVSLFKYGITHNLNDPLLKKSYGSSFSVKIQSQRWGHEKSRRRNCEDSRRREGGDDHYGNSWVGQGKMNKYLLQIEENRPLQIKSSFVILISSGFSVTGRECLKSGKMIFHWFRWSAQFLAVYQTMWYVRLCCPWWWCHLSRREENRSTQFLECKEEIIWCLCCLWRERKLLNRKTRSIY